MLPPPPIFVSVAAKGLTGAWRGRESNRLGWEDIGGVRRTTARGRMVRTEESCRLNETILAYWYSLSIVILSGLDAVGPRWLLCGATK